MRAEDLLPDHVNQVDLDGVTIRKGTVGAFLVNAREWLDPASPEPARQAAGRDMLEAMPALRALGLFDLLDVRDERLRAFVGLH